MRSSCPHCLSQIEHAHSDSQVVCASCGEIFSPFLTAQDSAQGEPAPSDFSESALAFKEIIDFGQSLNSSNTPENKQEIRSMSGSVSKAPSSAPSESVTDFILSTVDLGSNYRVTQWCLPLSRMVVLGDDYHPLEKAFQDLKEDAQKLGANAIVGIRCTLSPDNKRALILGTPIRCERNQ
ncbi:MAG: hypothetical protein ACKN9V_06110 [Pseudomonadota bacterium]